MFSSIRFGKIETINLLKGGLLKASGSNEAMGHKVTYTARPVRLHPSLGHHRAFLYIHAEGPLGYGEVMTPLSNANDHQLCKAGFGAEWQLTQDIFVKGPQGQESQLPTSHPAYGEMAGDVCTLKKAFETHHAVVSPALIAKVLDTKFQEDSAKALNLEGNEAKYAPEIHQLSLCFYPEGSPRYRHEIVLDTQTGNLLDAKEWRLTHFLPTKCIRAAQNTTRFLQQILETE